MNPTRSLLVLLTVATAPLVSQEKAVTSVGRKVLLYPDGTWKEDSAGSRVETSAGNTRPAASTVKASILKGRASIYFNPNKWKAKGPEEGGRSTFIHVDGDAQAMLITERIQMPLASLEKVALDNAKAAAADATLVFKEMRRVNGLELLVLQIKGTVSGTPFHYYGYYYAGEKGVIQAITFTAQNLFPEYRTDFEEFLNGLTLEP